MTRDSLWKKIKDLREEEFESLAIEVFRYQALENPVYKEFLELLNIDPLGIEQISEIPFLPIQFFKNHRVVTGDWEEEIVFESSTTTTGTPSRHYIKDLDAYRHYCILQFEKIYGSLKDWKILALLPGYSERPNASLVHMIEGFIKRSGNPRSGFFKDDIDGLIASIYHSTTDSAPTLLIGVSFALLDLIGNDLPELRQRGMIIMETGGMKGKRTEITRTELHQLLSIGFGVRNIHSEYGMTELQSQAYSTGDGIFKSGPWMKVICREINDPFTEISGGKTGRIDIIDLLNLDSCSFIATDDLGRMQDEDFEVLGRKDDSEVRGCNLMAYNF